MFDPQRHKAVIFDLGAVLLNIDYGLTSKAFKDLGVDDIDQLFSKKAQTILFDKYEKGFISEKEFCDGVRKISQLDISDQQIINAWNAMLLDFPVERLQLLDALNKTYPIFLLSNTNYTHLCFIEDYLQMHFGFKNFGHLFKKEYYSHKIGMRKPDAEIFELVLRENNLDAHTVFYIDDSIQHIEGAKKLGIDAYWLEVEKENIMDLFRTLRI